jgi:hypothetical protein
MNTGNNVWFCKMVISNYLSHCQLIKKVLSMEVVRYDWYIVCMIGHLNHLNKM